MDLQTTQTDRKSVSLAEYASGLASNGKRIMPGAPGTFWVQYETGAMMRMPVFCLDPPKPSEIRRILWQGAAALVSYLVKPDGGHPANALLYVCTDPGYALDKLISRARRDVRRGFREFRIEPITAEQLMAHGAQAFGDTLRRIGLRGSTTEEFRRQVALRAKCPGHVFLGAWKEGQLAAYLSIAEVEDWAEIETACSADAFLRFTPNDALFFYALSHYLTERGCHVVTVGLSSVQPESNKAGLHAFKAKVGLEAQPVHRAFVLHPLLRPFATRLTLWSLNAALRFIPRERHLKKAGGVLACVLARDASPTSGKETGQ